MFLGDRGETGFRKTVGMVARSRDGSVSVFTALMIPIMVGGLALAIDAGYWRLRKANLQSAADAAAVSAYMNMKGGMSSALLRVDAVGESAKNGCTTDCTVAFSSTGSGSTGKVTVTLTDTRPASFFTPIIGISPQNIVASATAGQGAVTNWTMSMQTIPTPDDGCLLAFGGYAMWGIKGVAPAGVPANCTLIGNGALTNNASTHSFIGWRVPDGHTNSLSFIIPGLGINGQFNDNATLNGTAYATGYVSLGNRDYYGQAPLWTNNGFVAQGQAAVADPYQGQVTLSSTTAPGPNDAYPSATSTPVEISLRANGVADNNAAQGGNTPPGGARVFKGFTWSAATQSWNIDGGAHWTAGIRVDPGVTVNMTNGTYVIDNDVLMDGATVNVKNGTLVFGSFPVPASNYTYDPSTGKVRYSMSGGSVSSSTKGDYTDSPYDTYAENTVNFGPGTTLNLVAPTSGPMSGVAMSGYVDGTTANGGSTVLRFFGSSAMSTNIYITGDIYMPVQNMELMNFAYLTAGSPNAAQGSSACGRVLVATLLSLMPVNIGNSCSAANGVQPFGTPFSSQPSSMHWAPGTVTMMAPTYSSMYFGKVTN